MAAERFVGVPDIGGEGRGLFIVAERDKHRGAAVAGREGMDGQFTKSPPEGDEAISRDLLIAENQELMPGQRLLDGLDLLLCQVSAEVDAGYIGA